MIITSNSPPEHWYKFKNYNPAALFRRIDKLQEFGQAEVDIQCGQKRKNFSDSEIDLDEDPIDAMYQPRKRIRCLSDLSEYGGNKWFDSDDSVDEYGISGVWPATFDDVPEEPD